MSFNSNKIHALAVFNYDGFLTVAFSFQKFEEGFCSVSIRSNNVNIDVDMETNGRVSFSSGTYDKNTAKVLEFASGLYSVIADDWTTLEDYLTGWEFKFQ